MHQITSDDDDFKSKSTLSYKTLSSISSKIVNDLKNYTFPIIHKTFSVPTILKPCTLMKSGNASNCLSVIGHVPEIEI